MVPVIISLMHTTVGASTETRDSVTVKLWLEMFSKYGRHFVAIASCPKSTAGVTHVGEGPADCIPVLYVNGAWWGPVDEAGDRGPDSRLVPADIEAIEIYNHPSILPDQFNSGKEAQDCGVVVLWMIAR